MTVLAVATSFFLYDFINSLVLLNLCNLIFGRCSKAEQPIVLFESTSTTNNIFTVSKTVNQNGQIDKYFDSI